MKADREFVKDIISLAIKKGADEAEVYVKSAKTLSTEIKDQKIDALESSLSFGYSLRVIRDKRLGFSYATDRDSIRSVVDNAVEAARWTDKDEYLELPQPHSPHSVDIFDPKISSIGEEEVTKKVSLLEKAAYETDGRIKNIRKARGSFSKADILIMNSRGVDSQYPSTSCAAQIMTVAEDGANSQMGWYFAGSRFLDEVSFEEVGQNAARRALQLLDSRKMNTQKAHVILDNLVAAEFIEVFASSLSSENVQKGKSLLSGKLGKKVVSSRINIVDSGLLSGKLGSSPVDDEGVSAREKILISEGVLQSYLYNTYTAKKDRVLSTGNAVRSGISSPPSVGVSNLYIEAASKSYVMGLKELFKAADKCLYITEAMGIHFINPVSGEFSIGVSGLWIIRGEIEFPVKEAVISGNLLSFFENIDASGDDLRFFGSVGAPSLLFGPTDISA